jgi:hypothetical protein
MNSLVIQWYNQKVYSPETINKRIAFVSRNMNYPFPLYGREEEKLEKYANNNNISMSELKSMRNILKIQRDICSGHRLKTNLTLIQNNFRKLVSKSPDDPSHGKITTFIKQARVALPSLIKIIKNMPEFSELDPVNTRILFIMQEKMNTANVQIHEKAVAFEELLAQYLTKLDIPFLTEKNLRLEDYSVTPDILFERPIILKVGDQSHVINWIDAKNYILIKVSFIMKSLAKQAAKYYDKFGSGAFVFHLGVDASITIPNVVILDGSYLDTVKTLP